MMDQERPAELTLAMLDELFRGRNLAEDQGFILPNGDYLNGSDLRMLFESYTGTV